MSLPLMSEYCRSIACACLTFKTFTLIGSTPPPITTLLDAIASDIVAVATGERPFHRKFFGSGTHVPRDPGITVGQYATAVNRQLELEVGTQRCALDVFTHNGGVCCVGVVLGGIFPAEFVCAGTPPSSLLVTELAHASVPWCALSHVRFCMATSHSVAR